MTKSPAQIDAEIAEALRAKKWQDQVAREDAARRARIAAPGPSPDQIYEEHAADLAAGVHHGERRGRSRALRRAASPEEARMSSGFAARLSEEALTAASHREAAAAHVAAAKKHKSDPAGVEVAWLHDLAASNHRQAAQARASKTFKNPRSAPGKTFAKYQEKLAAAVEHGHMAQEYARQALAAAKKRS